MSTQEDNNNDEIEDIKDMKVFSFEEIGKLISARLDEVSEQINNIPTIVKDELRAIKEIERADLYKKLKYYLNIILTSGFINGIIQLSIIMST